MYSNLLTVLLILSHLTRLPGKKKEVGTRRLEKSKDLFQRGDPGSMLSGRDATHLVCGSFPTADQLSRRTHTEYCGSSRGNESCTLPLRTEHAVAVAVAVTRNCRVIGVWRKSLLLSMKPIQGIIHSLSAQRHKPPFRKDHQVEHLHLS